MAGHYGGNPFSWDGGTNAPHIARYYIARGWVNPTDTVLDAGCCTGYGTKMIGQFAKKVIGIEIDKGCIESALAYKNTNPEMHKNVKFKLGDLGKIEWPDVDVTISIEVAEHVLNFDHYLEQLQKHTKRMYFICVPIGGTSWAYKDEPEGPGTEKNDFNNREHFESIFATNGWRAFMVWDFGYSVMGVFVRDSWKGDSDKVW